MIVVIQNKKVVVFYGSQTGTGEGFAGRLAKDARRFGLPSMVYDPEDCTDWVRGCVRCSSVLRSKTMYLPTNIYAYTYPHIYTHTLNVYMYVHTCLHVSKSIDTHVLLLLQLWYCSIRLACHIYSSCAYI